MTRSYAGLSSECEADAMSQQEIGRGDLLAALNDMATFSEGLLDVTETLISMLGSDTRPTPEDLARWRQGLDGWRLNCVELRQRIAGLAHVPPDRVE